VDYKNSHSNIIDIGNFAGSWKWKFFAISRFPFFFNKIIGNIMC